MTWSKRAESPQVGTVLVTATAHDQWRAVLGACQWPTYVVCDPGSYQEASSFPAVKVCAAWHGPFAWGPLASLLMRTVTEPWAMFLHDDALPPDDDGMAAMLSAAEESDSKMIVPSIIGDTRCMRQRQKLTGWSHLTEIASDACAMVDRATYEESGGFPAVMPGKSFDIPWFQMWLCKQGMTAVVAHDAVVRHSGSKTLAATLSVEERRYQVAAAMRWAASRLGYPQDYSQRIGVPRLVQRSSEACSAVRHTTHLAIGGIRVALTGEEATHELIDLIVNHAPSDVVEYEGRTFKRYARGDKFVPISRQSVFKIGAHNRLGLGDTFHMMKLFACLKATYPECVIEAHSDISNGALFERCPDVDTVVHDSYSMMPKDGIDIHRFQAFGIENAAANLARHFGVEYRKEPARYVVRSSDAKAAATVLDAHGRDKSRPLLAVQAHGGWKAKQWCHTVQFVRQACHRGWQVWLIGTHPSPRLNVGEDVVRTGPLGLPVLAACLAECDAIVGFDSGAVHMAAAIGVPIVSFWGPHDPKHVLLDADVYNAYAIRKRVPLRDCGKDNCRKKHGGAECPFKNGAPGALCIDEVTTAEAWKLVEEAVAASRIERSA